MIDQLDIFFFLSRALRMMSRQRARGGIVLYQVRGLFHPPYTNAASSFLTHTMISISIVRVFGSCCFAANSTCLLAVCPMPVSWL